LGQLGGGRPQVKSPPSGSPREGGNGVGGYSEKVKERINGEGRIQQPQKKKNHTPKKPKKKEGGLQDK